EAARQRTSGLLLSRSRRNCSAERSSPPDRPNRPPTQLDSLGPIRNSTTRTPTISAGTRNSRRIICPDGGCTGGSPGTGGGGVGVGVIWSLVIGASLVSRSAPV